jgi:hypothetical protein
MTATERNLYADLMDYYNMIQANLPTTVKWKNIRSRHFIGLKTVWQRCVEIQPVDENVIGEYRPSAYTILQMINELKGEWYFKHVEVREYVKNCEDYSVSVRAITHYERGKRYPFRLTMDGVCYGYATEEQLFADYFTLKLVFPNFECDFELHF